MKILISLLLLSMGMVLSAEKVASLTELRKPTDILFCKGNIYVMDEATVKVFGADRGKYKFSFARKGEGPGEIKLSRFITNTMTLHKGHIAIDSMDKVIFYTPEGKFVKEKKKGRFMALQTKPVGDSFIVKAIDRKDSKCEYITLAVYDSDMEKVKEIARQKSNIQMGSTMLIPDSLHFAVSGDKIFVERSDKNFRIEEYDAKGQLINTIEKSVALKPVAELNREDALSRYKRDPLVKQIGFENLKKRIDFRFPSSFPAIEDIVPADDKLAVRTFNRKNGEVEFRLIDKKGKDETDFWGPPAEEGEIISQLNGVEPKLYSFHKGFYYFLKENLDNEEYELHRKKLKN